MYSISILDPAANHLIRHMVLVENVQISHTIDRSMAVNPGRCHIQHMICIAELTNVTPEASVQTKLQTTYHLSPVKRICVFEHSVMTNFNCACPAIQRGQVSGFLSEGSP